MKKKFLTLVLSCVLPLSLVACGGTNTNSSENSAQSDSSVEIQQEPLTQNELRSMFSNPDNYIGSKVELSGIVFGSVDSDENGIYFQIWSDPVNMDWNTVIGYLDPSFQLEDGQYVKVTGVVDHVAEGENMMGVTITAPAILADTVEVSSYIDVVSPTIATAAAIQSTVDQYGYAVTLEKVELAENETRLYVSLTNNGPGNFTLYEFNATIIQDGTQYEYQSNYDADYPELQNDIRPGVTTEGIITFPAIQQAPFQVIMEAHSNNWSENFSEYTFDVNFE